MSISNNFKYKGFNNLINSFYNDEINQIDYISENSNKIKLEAKVIYDKFSAGLKLEFIIGNKKMYKIKDLTDFYSKMINNEFVKYANGLEFVHKKENFEEESWQLLDFLLKYAEIMKYSNSGDKYSYYINSVNKSYIIIGKSSIDEMFDLLKNKNVKYDYEYADMRLEMLEQNPDIEFILEKVNNEELCLKPNINVFKIALFTGKEYSYFLQENKLFRCDNSFADSILKIIKIFRENYTSEMFMHKMDLKSFCNVIYPKIENNMRLKKIDKHEIEELIPKKLAVKVFLDFDNSNYLVADVKYCYDDEEFNPLNQNIKIIAVRNKLEEEKCLNIFNKSGFMLDVKNNRFILPDDDKIYNFLVNDINYYMEKFEVLVTDNFKLKELKENKILSIGVKIENNLLNIDLSKISISSDEINDIMEKYKLKKKFYRLKDGSFLSLYENDEIDFLHRLSYEMDVDYKDLGNGTISLPISRTLYLNQLLNKLTNTVVTKDLEYKKLVNNFEKNKLDESYIIPDSLKCDLRDYQKNGFIWLNTLDNYRFGGILADDMGLGKTVQLLAVILYYVNIQKEGRKASIVVAPSSLTLNWLNEANKFAPTLNVLLISGTAFQRMELINKISEYDLVITSYDLLKRDSDKYKDLDYEFKYIIADEAQYLKNTNTQNAKSIKQIKAETRFALTGTPIENSLSELWSIFDFIMPGYLFQYRKFKTLYETPIVKNNDVISMNKLKMLIEPFILRRTKKEVLKELPEKTITVLNNTMEEEQEKLYMSYLVKAKQEVSEYIKINGFEKSQMAILSALTRLRQICCHPGLFLSDYKGCSSKLNQCTEIIKEAVNSGHKILLFSGYTSMFEYIEKELKDSNIKYYELTGATKVVERIKLVDDFNQNDEIKVFLISLKAGGTGLNLTGADVVIHYDPWWNMSAENQATDRAYRIGQKNNVQVYKLITSNSIEEKIYELQQKKNELIDNVLLTKPTFISKFSKEEIMDLFN